MTDTKWEKLVKRNERKQTVALKKQRVSLYCETEEDEYLIIEEKYGKKINFRR